MLTSDEVWASITDCSRREFLQLYHQLIPREQSSVLVLLKALNAKMPPQELDNFIENLKISTTYMVNHC